MANWTINLKMKSYMPLFFKKCWFIENPWQRTFCVNTNCLLFLASDCLGHFGTGLIVFFLVWRIKRKIYWFIQYLLFYVPLKNFSLIWRRHHYRWRAAKYRPMQWGIFYRATPAVTRDLSFSGFIHRTAPYSHLNDIHGDAEDLF
jgi:hypothetical protein